MKLNVQSLVTRLALATSCLMISASAALAISEPPDQGAVPFKYAAGHMLLIPVKVCGQESSFLLDTGSGVTVLNQALAKKLKCKTSGIYSGKRMSGQELTMKQGKVASLQLGSTEQKDMPIAVWNIEPMLAGEPDLKNVEGMISLTFFKNTPFTIDYGQKKIYFENDDTLKKREEAGKSVPVEVIDKSNLDTSVMLPIKFSNGETAKVEVDTGSSNLILDQHYFEKFGLKPEDKTVRSFQGMDETGNSIQRYFTNVTSDVSLADAASIKQSTPRVQFQKIIYDGLVGDGFMKNFVVTYDLPHKRMIFAALPPAPSAPDAQGK